MGFLSEVEMMKLVVPGWARPRQMVGKEAGTYKLFATEGEPCLFKHVSPRDIEQGHLAQLANIFMSEAFFDCFFPLVHLMQQLRMNGNWVVNLVSSGRLTFERLSAARTHLNQERQGFVCLFLRYQ